METKPADNQIILPNDPELYERLRDLGMEDLESQKRREKTLTRGDCDRAGISFEFFRAFARLTEVDSLQEGIALRLLKPEMPKQPSSAIFSRRDSPDRLVPVEKNRKGQAVADGQLDREEAQALLAALRVLGNAETARRRINELGQDDCALRPESLRLEIFGQINHESRHSVTLLSQSLAERWMKLTTRASEYPCRYHPSMSPLTRGLFFRTDHLPASIRRAAASTVILDLSVGCGSGVIIHPRYILTAFHNIEHDVRLRNGGKVTSFTVVHNGTAQAVEAEVIPISENPQHDLVLLYIPQLSPPVEPLPFSEKVALLTPQVPSRGVKPLPLGFPRFPKGIPDNFEIEKVLGSLIQGFQMREIHYPEREVFLLGAPHQKAPRDILVSVGTLGETHTWLLRGGLAVTSAITLPGSSGGPVVDSEGKLVGITIGMHHPPDQSLTEPFRPHELVEGFSLEEIRRSFPHLLHWEITGTSIYLIAEWGPAIRKAIQSHQKKLRFEWVPLPELESAPTSP